MSDLHPGSPATTVRCGPVRRPRRPTSPRPERTGTHLPPVEGGDLGRVRWREGPTGGSRRQAAPAMGEHPKATWSREAPQEAAQSGEENLKVMARAAHLQSAMRATHPTAASKGRGHRQVEGTTPPWMVVVARRVPRTPRRRRSGSPPSLAPGEEPGAGQELGPSQELGRGTTQQETREQVKETEATCLPARSARQACPPQPRARQARPAQPDPPRPARPAHPDGTHPDRPREAPPPVPPHPPSRTRQRRETRPAARRPARARRACPVARPAPPPPARRAAR